MGKQGWNAGGRGGQDKQYGNYGRKWDYWPGTWRSPYRARSLEFPSYDADWKGEQLVEIRERDAEPDPTTQLMNHMQSTINQSRKYDNKLAKLLREQEERSRKWEAYNLKLQKAFQAEKKRHYAEQERIAREIEEIKGLRKQAHHHMVQTAELGTAETIQMMDVETRSQWEKITGELRAEQEALPRFGGHPANNHMAAPPEPTHEIAAHPAAPPGVPSEVVAQAFRLGIRLLLRLGPLRSYSGLSPKSRVEPYVAASPKPALDAAGNLASKDTGQQTLADELNAARGNALAPFRAGGVIPTTASADASTDGHQAAAAIDLDSPTNAEPPPGLESPGLRKMECTYLPSVHPLLMGALRASISISLMRQRGESVALGLPLGCVRKAALAEGSVKRCSGQPMLASLVPLAACASPTFREKVGAVPPRNIVRGKGFAIGLCGRICLWVILALQCPHLVWAAPKCAAELTQFYGLTDFAGAEDFPVEGSALADALPDPLPGHDSTRRYLGVQIMAPNFQHVYMQVPADRWANQDDVMAQAVVAATHHFHHDFAHVVPTDPQIFQGYATFVAETPWLAASGQVVVVLDLLRLSGNRFACMLPNTMSVAQLSAYIAPLVGIDADSIEIYIGAALRVRAPAEEVQLVSGQVITAMPLGILPHFWGSVEELLANPDSWGPADQFPRPLARAGICLLHEGRRFFVNRRFYPGQPANEAAAQCAGLTPSTSIMRVARSPALENVAMHGNDCKGVACVVGVPPPPTSADSPDRGDNVLFFDLRPLLQRPIYHYQIGQTRHWPTVLSSLGVSAPRGMQLQIEGASHSDGFVTTSSGHTIVVRAFWPPVDDASLRDVENASEDRDDEYQDDHSNGPGSESGAPSVFDSSEADSDANEAPSRPRSRSPRRYGAAGCCAAHLRQKSPFTGPADMWICSLLKHAPPREPCNDTPVYVGKVHGPLSGVCWSIVTNGTECMKRYWGNADFNSFKPTCPELETARQLRLASCMVCCLRALCVVVCVETAALSWCAWAFVARCFVAKGQDSLGSQAPQAARDERNAQLLRTPTQGPPSPLQSPTPDFQIDHPATGQQPRPLVVRHWTFVVLYPQHSREDVVVPLPAPCHVQQAINAVSAARDEQRQLLFGNLIPVVPQPADDFGTLIAAPAAVACCVVCVDLRQVDGRFFCLNLPDRMNRESLLAAFGLTVTPGLDVLCSCAETTGLLIRSCPVPISADGSGS
ncbi:unnamed protein product [Symbiodinium necroappetens]|uniref:Uncharacterized protein n=1 Tax=Symbiodinium necroappetens TaxID=1628268 RepID=A0A812L0G0_9DINO|nr:unnamed protein product [Symbiodinium necroappetens]